MAFVFAWSLRSAVPATDEPYATWGHDPYAARIVTADVDRFWSAYDARSARGTAEAMRGYLAAGSPGLADFVPKRIISAEHLSRTVDAHESYYRAVRASTLRARDFAPQIRRAFVRMHELIGDDAVFPDVYFVVGALNSGGTAGGHGLIIGTEMEALPAQRDAAACVNLAWQCANASSIERVPFIVAHELTHAEQWALNQSREEEVKDATLFQLVLAEGVADYVGERASGLPRAAQYVAFGATHADEIRREFLAKRNSRDADDIAEFLYGGPKRHAWPHDLGYDVGYRIARGYVGHRHDDQTAIRELLAMQDPERILAVSGYATEQF
jgi:Predicted Zn-dependent protease (DUF2268)